MKKPNKKDGDSDSKLNEEENQERRDDHLT